MTTLHLFALLTLSHLIITSWAEIPIHIISGARFEEVTTIIPYQSSTQLLYRFPYHTKATIKLPTTIFKSSTCKNSISNPDTFCSNKYHLQQIQNELNSILNMNEVNLNPEFKIKVGLLNVTSRQKRAIDFIGDALSWCCNTATMNNLHDLSRNEELVDNKMNDLLDYVKAEYLDITVAEEDKMNKFSNNIDHVLKQLHTSLLKYEQTLNTEINVTSSTLESKIIQSNLEIMSYIYLSARYATLYKIEHDCQHNYIPEDLLDMQTLQADLRKLATKLIPLNLEIALSFEMIHRLYSLPISKCYFENESIIVHVKIPLSPLNITYKAYRYQPIPLMWENNICKLVDHNFVILKSSAHSTFIVDTENNPDCDQRSSNLCLVPRYNSFASIASNCARYLINGTNLSELRKHCEFHCTQAPNHPVITQIHVNKFYLVNYGPNLHIECDNNPLTTKIPLTKFGTVEISLPCNCKLLDESTTVVSTIIPCDSRDYALPSVYHLVPLPWTNLDHLKLDPFNSEKTVFSNISNYLLPQWNLSVPTFVDSKFQKVTLFKHVDLATKWTDVINDKRLLMYILLVWCAVLTILLAVIIYKIHILTIRMDLRPPQLPPRTYNRSAITMGDSAL